ncbi:ribosome-associated translation inhibitor RaiA [Beijerinckia sp. L45]|uniref:ribosome hibernation-promoting factor, HPF/YfiA family n=1 Tax=Beijerinckia sp. L45 TaxID=1641855 RepID=UPI00131E5BBC|nr:ribosome-associated translation inhibitor RaiA [Beijerinckia sp. L45]
MTLRISGKNLAIGDALRSHVQARIDGVTAKYHAGAPSGHVTIGPEGSGYRSDCTLFLAAGITLQVDATAHEPYVSFDKAADRIERRLRRHKKRQTSHHGNGAIAALADVDGDLEPFPVDLLEEIDEETFPVVISEPAHGFKEMTVAAAVRQLDSAACSVVIFRYAENSRINIVYRRADGNIGWIDPLGVSNGKAS